MGDAQRLRADESAEARAGHIGPPSGQRRARLRRVERSTLALIRRVSVGVHHSRRRAKVRVLPLGDSAAAKPQAWGSYFAAVQSPTRLPANVCPISID